MSQHPALARQIQRRTFLKKSSLILSTAVGLRVNGLKADETEEIVVRAALVTDLHYADKPANGNRYYQETCQKLEHGLPLLKQFPLDFAVELGDLIDSGATVEEELHSLKEINKVFSQICPQRYYVLGNHCVERLTKPEFLQGVNQKKSYDSFDCGPVHFIYLDACYRHDGVPYGRKNAEWTDPNIPPQEIEWLKEDLKATTKPTIVFIHQRLDVDNHYAVKNASQVRQILEESDKVLAVFQGHSHKNDYKQRNGIHYCTLAALIEGSGLKNSAYSHLEITAAGQIRLHGFAQQQSYRWA